MNKFILKLFLTVAILFNLSIANATDASMTTAFNTALNNVVGDSNNLEIDTIQNYPAWRLLYNNSNSGISTFGTTDNGNYGYISLSADIDLAANFGYQCVGFVKAITNLGSTSTWIEGNQVSRFNLPNRGDVIATFDENGDYDFGHVAVVLSASNTHIYVIDQNWEGTGETPVGRVIIHAISFDGTGNADADNYSIVEF